MEAIAIAIRLKAIAIRLEATAIRFGGHSHQIRTAKPTATRSTASQDPHGLGAQGPPLQLRSAEDAHAPRAAAQADADRGATAASGAQPHVAAAAAAREGAAREGAAGEGTAGAAAGARGEGKRPGFV